MLPLPDFTENTEDAVLLYFELPSNADASALSKKIESCYACSSPVKTIIKNGKRYIVAEMPNGEI